MTACAAVSLILTSLAAGPAQPATAPVKVVSANPGWVLVTPKAAFSPRDTAEDLVYDGKMWISNAYYHGNKLTRDLWQSADGKTWTRVLDHTPYDGYSELVAYKDAMWTVKGSVWRSTDGKAWTEVLDKTPFGARGYGETLVFRNKVWQLGSGADVWTTTDLVHWTCLTDRAPYGRRSASAVVAFRDKLWLMGGSTVGKNAPPEKGYADKITYNDVWCSTDGKQWRRVVARAPWAPRHWHVAKVYRGHIWIIGGHDNVHSKNLGDVWCSPDGTTWKRFESKIQFSPRHEVTCYVYDDSLWVVAGNAWPVQNDVWRLTLPEHWPA